MIVLSQLRPHHAMAARPRPRRVRTCASASLAEQARAHRRARSRSAASPTSSDACSRRRCRRAPGRRSSSRTRPARAVPSARPRSPARRPTATRCWSPRSAPTPSRRTSRKLPYNTVTDFTPIAHLADSDLFVLAAPKLGVKNMAELLALGRSKPGYLNYTSSGIGTIAHLSFELLSAQTGVVMNHIPYKGTGSAIADLSSGVVHLSLDGVTTGIPHVNGGRVRGLATTGPRRSALLPDTPTVAETVPGFQVVSWFGLYGPRGMSPELTKRIHDEVAKVIQSPEMVQRFKAWASSPGAARRPTSLPWLRTTARGGVGSSRSGTSRLSEPCMNNEAKPVVGFIGLGIMGGPMSHNLMKAGYRLVVHDKRREAAARHVERGPSGPTRRARSPSNAKSCFPACPDCRRSKRWRSDPTASSAGIRRGTRLFRDVDEFAGARQAIARCVRRARSAHARRADQRRRARRTARGGWRYGSAATRRSSSATSPCSARWPIIRRTSVAIGAGLVTKLVHNCAAEAMQAALAEAFVLGVKAGAEPLSLWEAIRQGAVGRRRTFDGLIDQFLPANYDQPRRRCASPTRT